MIPFHCSNYELTDGVKLTIIDIPSIDGPIRTIVDKSFVEICEGESDTSLLTVKKRVNSLFETKPETWRMGATAEFFVHLYMKLTGFKQEFLFLNLEENSIKKGFDGLYSFSNIPWLMESKSGKASASSHADKVIEAMNDLTKKVAGIPTRKKPNNPWQNAFSHANQFTVNTAEPLRKWIKKLSNEFTNGTFHSIDEFNTMPCGTVFLAGKWTDQDHEAICSSIQAIAAKLKGKEIHAVCVTHASVTAFVEYISSEE